MTATSTGDLRAIAGEVIDSLRVGDHRNNPQTARAGLEGFAALLLGALRPGRPRHTASTPAVVFAVANPVAHGARFSAAAARALATYGRTAVVADASVATAALDIGTAFPGLGRRALATHTTWRSLVFAVRCRLRAHGRDVAALNGSRAWREFVFVAQAARFHLASALLRDLPATAVFVTDYDRHAYSRPLIAAASAAGMRTATLVHGAPNAANYAPAIAANVLAWGDAQDAWWESMSPETTRHIVGRPDLVRRVDPLTECTSVIVAHSKEKLDVGEEARLQELLSAAAERGARTTLRVHPSLAPSELDGAWARLAATADAVDSGTGPLADVAGPETTVVVVSSSTLVDALLAGARGVVVASEDRELPCEVAYVRRRQSADLVGQVFGVAADLDEHFRSLTTALVRSIGRQSEEQVVNALHRIAGSAPPAEAPMGTL